MKTAELNALDDQALVNRELSLERELVELTFRLRTGQLEDSSRLGRLRKDIARARTAQRTRELTADKAKNTLRDRHRSAFKPGAAEAAPAAPKSSGFLKGIVDKIGGKS